MGPFCPKSRAPTNILIAHLARPRLRLLALEAPAHERVRQQVLMRSRGTTGLRRRSDARPPGGGVYDGGDSECADGDGDTLASGDMGGKMRGAATGAGAPARGPASS